VLPTQLKRLQLNTNHGPRLLRVVSPLQQLQQLKLEVCFPESWPLLRLAQLPALQQLALQYTIPRYAAGAAAAWSRLPQLQELSIGSGDKTCIPTQAEMERLLACGSNHSTDEATAGMLLGRVCAGRAPLRWRCKPYSR
jgi:hypothetical protein